jgi:hypothetical protein
MLRSIDHRKGRWVDDERQGEGRKEPSQSSPESSTLEPDIDHLLGAARDHIQRVTAAATATFTGYDRNLTGEANYHYYLP